MCLKEIISDRQPSSEWLCLPSETPDRNGWARAHEPRRVSPRYGRCATCRHLRILLGVAASVSQLAVVEGLHAAWAFNENLSTRMQPILTVVSLPLKPDGATREVVRASGVSEPAILSSRLRLYSSNGTSKGRQLACAHSCRHILIAHGLQIHHGRGQITVPEP